MGLEWLPGAICPDARPYARPVTFAVGFDLDMTLIDPRSGMVVVFDRLAREFGLPLDGLAFVGRIGPPLESEFARYGLDEDIIAALVARYRELYPDLVIPTTTALPGAVEAVRSVIDNGGRVIVVTAKRADHARAHLDRLGIEVSAVVGGVWSADKGAALADFGAEIYVGDHLGDIAGARAADALSVAVATGPITAGDLAAAGADVVLKDLIGFPDWLDNYLLATVH